MGIVSHSLVSKVPGYFLRLVQFTTWIVKIFSTTIWWSLGSRVSKCTWNGCLFDHPQSLQAWMRFLDGIVADLGTLNDSWKANGNQLRWVRNQWISVGSLCVGTWGIWSTTFAEPGHNPVSGAQGWILDNPWHWQYPLILRMKSDVHYYVTTIIIIIMRLKAMIQTIALVACTDPPISETIYFIECD